MTASALLVELNNAGIHLSANGDHLRVQAKLGAVSPELRSRLARHKPELLAALRSELRTHLLTLAEVEALPAATVHSLTADDVAACEGLPPDTLRAYLRVVDRGVVMDAGIAPLGYTQPVQCDGCGPVLLWVGCPLLVKACPWCFRRMAGKAIARPDIGHES